MATLNLGIVAHVDAGKTTLTELLLFETGVIASVGRVDHGDTVADSDALERRRGITIRSGVVAFHVGDLKVNLLDTPGHSDFVAEVERALSVLDGAVLVVSAVEGVQPQTRVLIRLLAQLRIPFLVFVNKIDRAGARHEEILAELRDATGSGVLAMTVPRCLGDRAAYVESPPADDLIRSMTEQIAEYDEALLAAYVDGRADLDEREATTRLAGLTARGLTHPTYAGAALRGVGVRELLDGIVTLLPHAAAADSAESLHAQVFKIEDSPPRPRVAFVRVRSGTLASRDQVCVHHRTEAGQVVTRTARASAVRTLDTGRATAERPASPGEIATVSGLGPVRIGDQLGVGWDPSLASRQVALPSLEAVVQAVDPSQRSHLFEALRRLSEQDPLIDARLDLDGEEVIVSLYGEVQKEVLAARLAEEFGIETEFQSTRTVHVERVIGTGEDTQIAATQNATVGLRIEPGAVDSALTYRLAIERGYLLPSYHTAIEETIANELRQGLYGWRVVDATVTLVGGRFSAPTPPAGYFRELTADALRSALQRAGTVVCEPLSAFDVELPASVMSSLYRELVVLGATPATSSLSRGRGRMTGTLATAAVHDLEQRLPHLTGGLGVMLVEAAGYRPTTGKPVRRR
jgi:ribosomal protection tetracycline resistance protein